MTAFVAKRWKGELFSGPHLEFGVMYPPHPPGIAALVCDVKQEFRQIQFHYPHLNWIETVDVKTTKSEAKLNERFMAIIKRNA